MLIQNIISENLKILERSLSKLPFSVVKSMKKEISIIKELMVYQRSPRLMIVGRRGAGKSSLLNAVFGEKVATVGSVISETGTATWYTCETSRGAIDLLDTRGLGDRTRPESAKCSSAINELRVAIDTICPDAILFLCKAKEVDSRISDDLSNVLDIIDHIKTRHHYQPRVLGIVTQVDELDPLSDTIPPFDKKLKNINIAVKTLASALKSEGIDSLTIIPICSYAEYDENCKPFFSKFWNIDKLVEYLVDFLPREAQVQIARISNVLPAQEKTCRMLIHSTATLCAGVATVPIPVADIFPITSLQIGMVTSVGYISGRSLSRENVHEFIASAGVNVGSAFILREIARNLIKLVIPGFGSAISASVAYAGTWALGEAAIAYYIQRRNIIDVQEVVIKVFKLKEKKKFVFEDISYQVDKGTITLDRAQFL